MSPNPKTVEAIFLRLYEYEQEFTLGEGEPDDDGPVSYMARRFTHDLEAGEIPGYPGEMVKLDGCYATDLSIDDEELIEKMVEERVLWVPLCRLVPKEATDDERA